MLPIDVKSLIDDALIENNRIEVTIQYPRWISPSKRAIEVR